MPVLRKREYLELQNQELTVCKAVVEGTSRGYKMSFHFQPSGKLANMNVTTFSSLQGDTKHFKHAMNAMMWGSLKYPSNVN
jgi:hypothetical protein